MKLSKALADEIINAANQTGNEKYFEQLIEDNRNSSRKANWAIIISVLSLVATISIGVLTLAR